LGHRKRKGKLANEGKERFTKRSAVKDRSGFQGGVLFQEGLVNKKRGGKAMLTEMGNSKGKAHGLAQSGAWLTK